MSCKTCKTEACTCVTTATECNVDCIQPVRMGLEDLTFGCSTEKQVRNCRKIEITQIHSGHIIYCPSGNSVADYIDDLRRMFPYIECDIGRPTMDYKDWVDAVISADVNSCALGLDDEITQRIPFMQGDVTRHDNCLWVSLIDNNLTEPSLKAQKQGKWLNTCSLVDVINCVLPVKEVPVCPDNCDGVEALPTLCDRVKILENAGPSDSGPDTYVDGFSIVDNALVIHRNDGTTFSIPLSSIVPDNGDNGDGGTVVHPQIYAYDWAFNYATFTSTPKELTAGGEMVVDKDGIYTISMSSNGRIKCNSASPTALVILRHAIFVNGIRRTGWIKFTHIERYSPLYEADRGQSSAHTRSLLLNAGDKVTVRMLLSYEGEKPSHLSGGINWNGVYNG